MENERKKQDLILFEGMDLSKYQLGDKIIITNQVMLKHFNYSYIHLYNKLVAISSRLGLWLWIEYDDNVHEYQIQLLDFEPPDFTVDEPDAEVSKERRKVWEKNQKISPDGLKS